MPVHRGDELDRYIEYIERCLPDSPGDKVLFSFKRKILDEMRERDEITEKRGIKDKKVREDLIISEYPRLDGDYAAYARAAAEKKKAKRAAVFNAAGSAVFILLLLIVYLAVSFATDSWGSTWVIIVDGILLWLCYLLGLGVKKITSLRRVFHIFARLLLAFAVMLAAVAAFLFSMAVLHIPHSWLFVIAGVAAVFAADSIYLAATGKKLAVIYYLAYIPSFTAMIYIIGGAAGLLPWSPGWVMIPLSLLIDAAIAAALIIRNKKIAREVAEHWNED